MYVKAPSSKKEIISRIKQASPLYEYWNSEQSNTDEKKRLLKISKEATYKDGLFLFEKEPYKWEILFQSIVFNLWKNKSSSTRALKKLLFTIDPHSRSKTLGSLEDNGVLESKTIEELKATTLEELKILLEQNSRNNITSFLIILIAIFTNPFNLNLKKEKIRIYEKTGSLIYSIKASLNLI